MKTSGRVEDQLDMKSVTPYPSLLLTTSTLLVCMLSLIAIWWHHPRYGRNKGPKLFPFLGCLPQMLLNANRLSSWVTDEILKTPTKTMRAPLLGWSLVRTANPENVEHVLKTKFENYPKGDYFRTFYTDFAGAGLFNADGSVWKMQRKFAVPFFSKHMMQTATLSAVREGLTEQFVPVLESFCDSKRVVDLQDLPMRSSFDSFCQFAFGTNPHCLNLELSSVPFATAFDDALHISFQRMVTVLPPWQVLKLFNVGSERRLRQALLTVDAFAFDMIKTRRKELLLAAKGESKQKEYSDGLSQFIPLADEFVKAPELKQRLEEDPKSKTESLQDLLMRDFMLNTILAARDTATCALSWFFWLLSGNPKVEAKICHEIQSTLDSRSDEHLPKSKAEPGMQTTGREDQLDLKTFSFEELKGMHYLHAALTESMRLQPPVPQDPRVAAGDDSLPDGTFIAKGTVVMVQIYAMGRNESIWGADCLEFLPERFLRDGSFVPPSPFAYPVFLAGPRMCMGMDMAMMQMKLIAATLLHRFVFVVRGGHRAEGHRSVTMKLKEGLPVYVCRRGG